MDIREIFATLKQMNGLIGVLDIELVEDEAGELACAMEVSGVHLGSPGVAHGGALMTLLDTALGVYALQHALKQGKTTSTVEIKVNMLRPAPYGSRLKTRCSTVSLGRTLMVLTGEVYDEASGEPVTCAMGTFNIFKVNREVAQHFSSRRSE